MTCSNRGCSKGSGALLNPDLIAAGCGAVLLALGFAGSHWLQWPRVMVESMYIAACVVAGWRVTITSLKQMMEFRLDVDLLMLVAAIGAGLIGRYGDGALLLILFSLGHGLEEFATGRARRAIEALGQVAPRTARLLRGTTEVEVPVESLTVGDIVVARPGERIPVDGTVASGESSVDQSPITGESVPVHKVAGAVVFAGTLNADGALIITTTRLASETTMARMVRLVSESEQNRGRTQRFAERFTRIYSPAILAGIPLLIGALIAFFGMGFDEAFLRAMTVLVGASPCALAISTPSAVIAGIARAAQGGVLIKGGEFLESLGEVRAIAFDKTGTLTIGRPMVEAVKVIGSGATTSETNGIGKGARPSANEVLRIANALDGHSLHPLGQAISREAAARGVADLKGDAVRLIPGRGLVGMIGGAPTAVGNEALFDGVNAPAITAQAAEAARILRERALTCVLVAREGTIVGIIGLADQPRPSAAADLKSLAALGVRQTVMLTGDNQQVADRIGSQVGVSQVLAALAPEDKVKHVRELKLRYHSVAFVGDGVNDAPALAEATVGIAMGACGTDIALEASDVALMSDDLSNLPFALGLSRATRRIIIQNVAISLGMVAVLIPLGVLGITNLQWAVVGHEGSTVLVAFNALRLLGYPRRR